MEKLLVGFLIILTVLGIELQYIVNKLLTPKGFFYLGTVHWPSDYFYYLSQFAQGSEHWLTSTMLFTPEKLTPVYIGWQNVLTGKLLMLAGLDVIAAYQAAVGIYLTLFLIISWLFIREIFPKNPAKRVLSLLFFLTSTSLFSVKFGAHGFEWSYFNHWYNLGIPLARFGPTPHHLLAYALGVASWLFYLRNRMFLLALSGFLHASINPVAWGLNVMVIAVCGFIPKLKIKSYFPAGVLFLSGILPALYAKAVFSQLPYSLSSAWESAQHLKLVPAQLFMGTGLVIILALFGLKNFPGKAGKGRIFSLVFLTLAVFFYLTDISEKFKISNARFWPSQVYLLWGLLAAEGILVLSKIFGKFKKVVLVILLLIYFTSIIPTLYLNYREILTPKYSNGSYFIPHDVYLAFREAKKISGNKDIFLVVWPFNESFPALTGRKTLFGYELFTINYQEKMTRVFAIIDGKMGEDELKRTLSVYKINYLLMYSPSEYFRKFPFFKEVYKNPTITIYRFLIGNIQKNKINKAL